MLTTVSKLASGVGERLDAAHLKLSHQPGSPEIAPGDFHQLPIEVDGVRLEPAGVLGEQPACSRRDLEDARSLNVG